MLINLLNSYGLKVLHVGLRDILTTNKVHLRFYKRLGIVDKYDFKVYLY